MGQRIKQTELGLKRPKSSKKSSKKLNKKLNNKLSKKSRKLSANKSSIFSTNTQKVLLIALVFVCTLDGTLSILVDPPALDFTEQPLATITEQRITITNNVDRRKAQIQDLLRSNDNNAQVDNKNHDKSKPLDNSSLGINGGVGVGRISVDINSNVEVERYICRSSQNGACTRTPNTSSQAGGGDDQASQTGNTNQQQQTTSTTNLPLPTSPLTNEKYETWVRLDPIRIKYSSKSKNGDFIVKSTFESDTQLLMPDEKAFIDVTFYPKLIQDYHAEFVISYQKTVMIRSEEGQTRVHEPYGDMEKVTVSIDAKGVHNSYLPHSFMSNNGLSLHKRIMHHNASYTTPLYFRNPNPGILRIDRIASTADCMHIDWAPDKDDFLNYDLKRKDGRGSQKLIKLKDGHWEFSPYELKSIAYYSYIPSLCSGDSKDVGGAEVIANNKYSREKFYNKPNEDSVNYFVVETTNIIKPGNEVKQRFLMPVHTTISRKPGVYSLEYILDFGVLWYDRDPVRQTEFENHQRHPEAMQYKQAVSMKSYWSHPSNASLAETVPKLTPYKRSLDIRVFSMCKPHTKWQDIQKQYFENSLPNFVSIKWNENIAGANQPRISVPCSNGESVYQNAITLATVTFDASKIQMHEQGGFIDGFLNYHDKSIKSTLSADTAALNYRLLGKIYTGKGVEVFNKTQLFFDIDKGASTREVWLINSYDQEIHIETITMIPTNLANFQKKSPKRNSEKNKHQVFEQTFKFKQYPHVSRMTVKPNQRFKAFEMSFSGDKSILDNQNTFNANIVVFCKDFLVELPVVVHANRLDIIPKAMTEFSHMSHHGAVMDLGKLEHLAHRFYSVEIRNSNPVSVKVKGLVSTAPWVIITINDYDEVDSSEGMLLQPNDFFSFGVVITLDDDTPPGPLNAKILIGNKMSIKLNGEYSKYSFRYEPLNFTDIFPGKKSVQNFKLATDCCGNGEELQILDYDFFGKVDGFKLLDFKNKLKLKGSFETEIPDLNKLELKKINYKKVGTIIFKSERSDCWGLRPKAPQQNRPCYLAPWFEDRANREKFDSRYVKWLNNLHLGNIDRINSAKNTSDQELEMFEDSVKNWQLWKDRGWSNIMMFLRIKTNVFSDIQIPIHGSFSRPKLVSERLLDFEVQDYDRESTRTVDIQNNGDLPVQIHAQSLDQYAANIGYRVYESVTLEAHEKARQHLLKLVENIVKSRPDLKLELNVKNPDNATEVLDSLVAKCEKSPCEKTPQFFAVSYDTKNKKTTSAKSITIPAKSSGKITLMYSALRTGVDRSLILLRNNLTYFDAFIARGTAVQETILISKVNERGRNQMPYGTLYPHETFVQACERGIKRFRELLPYRKHKWQRVFYSLFPSLLPPVDRRSLAKIGENITINDFIMQERFTLQNSGIKPIVITSVHVGPQGQVHNSSNLPVQCHYQGFSVSNCTGFVIPTDKPAMIYVHYAPDFHTNINGVKITFITNVTTRFDWNVSSFLPKSFLKTDGYSYIKSNVLRTAAEKHLSDNVDFQGLTFSETCRLMLPEPGNEEYIHFWTCIGFILIVMLTIIIALGEGHNWFIESCKWVSQDNEHWPPEQQELYFYHLWRLGIWEFLPVKKQGKVMSGSDIGGSSGVKNSKIPANASVISEKVETAPNKNISNLKNPGKKSNRTRQSSASSAATGNEKMPVKRGNRRKEESGKIEKSGKILSDPNNSRSQTRVVSDSYKKIKPISRARVYETSSDDDTSGWEQSTNTRKLRMQKRKEQLELQSEQIQQQSHEKSKMAVDLVQNHLEKVAMAGTSHNTSVAAPVLNNLIGEVNGGVDGGLNDETNLNLPDYSRSEHGRLIPDQYNEQYSPISTNSLNSIDNASKSAIDTPIFSKEPAFNFHFNENSSSLSPTPPITKSKPPPGLFPIPNSASKFGSKLDSNFNSNFDSNFDSKIQNDNIFGSSIFSSQAKTLSNGLNLAENLRIENPKVVDARVKEPNKKNSTVVRQPERNSENPTEKSIEKTTRKKHESGNRKKNNNAEKNKNKEKQQQQKISQEQPATPAQAAIFNNFVPRQANLKPKIRLLQRNKTVDTDSSPTDRRSPIDSKVKLVTKSGSYDFSKKPAAIGSERGGNSSNTESPDFRGQKRSVLISPFDASPFESILQSNGAKLMERAKFQEAKIQNDQEPACQDATCQDATFQDSVFKDATRKSPGAPKMLNSNLPPPLSTSSIFATDWSKTSVDTSAGLGFFGLSGATNFNDSLENSRNNSLNDGNNEITNGFGTREFATRELETKELERVPRSRNRSRTMPEGNGLWNASNIFDKVDSIEKESISRVESNQMSSIFDIVDEKEK